MENQVKSKEDTKKKDDSSRRERRSGDRNRERDAKAKERARRHRNDPSAVSPGAAVAKSGDDSFNDSERSAGGKTSGSSRRRDERDAKSKARARHKGSGASTPGAVAETGSGRRSSSDRKTSGSSRHKHDQDSKSKARARHKGSGASTPGAVAETNADSRETARRRKEGSRGTDDRHRVQRRKMKEKEAMAAVTPQSNRSNTASAPEEVPTASAIDIEEEEPTIKLETEYAVQGSLVAPDAPMTTAPLGWDEVPAASSENNDRQPPAPAKPFYCKAWFWIAIVFIVVGGVVAALFLLKSSNAPTEDPAPGANIVLNVTNTTEPSSTPSSSPTDFPSSAPTEFVVRYDPPSPDDCIAVANREPTSQEGLLLRSFQVPLDVELLEEKDGMRCLKSWKKQFNRFSCPSSWDAILLSTENCRSYWMKKSIMLFQMPLLLLAPTEENVSVAKKLCVYQCW